MMKIRKRFGNRMPESRPPEFGINSWLEDELYQQYLHDRKAVDPSWTKVFESNGGTIASTGNGAHTPEPAKTSNGVAHPSQALPQAQALPQGVAQVRPGEQLTALRGAAARIAENMNASLTIPLATSQRVIPVKVID